MHRWMDIAVYGHFGTPVLLFPTAAADFLEYERFLMMDALKPLLDNGRIKIYSINTINSDTWLAGGNPGRHASWWHNEYSYYVTEEVVPFIYADCGGRAPIITTGASFGALHAANHFFKRPDLFRGTIAMSGSYDLHDYTKGYSDDLTFFNSPVHYMKDWHDGHMWNLHASASIIIAAGQGNFEKPSRTMDMSGVLHSRNISHWCDIWGYDIHHDWPTWRSMLPYFLSQLA
jgi:esterase/lipase superfamily enzyme